MNDGLLSFGIGAETLSEIQNRLSSELGLSLTYMEVRFLVDDLKLMPKDREPPKVAEIGNKRAAAAPTEHATLGQNDPSRAPREAVEGSTPAAGQVSVSVDHLARPGALVSGQVTFSDGKSAQWYLDQMGRLGLIPKDTGYKPAAADLQTFQLELQEELARLGF